MRKIKIPDKVRQYKTFKETLHFHRVLLLPKPIDLFLYQYLWKIIESINNNI